MLCYKDTNLLMSHRFKIKMMVLKRLSI